MCRGLCVTCRFLQADAIKRTTEALGQLKLVERSVCVSMTMEARFVWHRAPLVPAEKIGETVSVVAAYFIVKT